MKFQHEKVIQVARSLFVVEGYQQVTMRKIARCSGYSHGTLYYHFKDKANLIHEILQQDFSQMREQLRHVLEEKTSPLEHLRIIIHRLIQFGIENPHHYRLMFIEKDPDFALFQLHESERTFQILLTVVSQCKDEFQDLPAHHIAWMIFMAAHGFISQNIAEPKSWETLSKLAEPYVEMMIRGLQKN